MPSPLATLTRRSGALVALAPCDSCGLDQAMCWEYGCPRLPDPMPPSEDDYERFLGAELARGRP